jgi:hypothetical protein
MKIPELGLLLNGWDLIANGTQASYEHASR